MPSLNTDAKSIRSQILENQEIIDRLNQKLSRKTQEVRIIQEISAEITSTLHLDRILNVILRSMDKVLGFKHAMILLLDESGEKLKVAASRGYEETGVGASVTVGQGVIGVVAKRRRIIRMGNIGASMAYVSAVRSRIEEVDPRAGHALETVKLPGLVNVHSQIGIPLLAKEKLIGVFAVESPKPNAFDELDEMLLTILANQAAISIENARLYNNLEQRVAERTRELREKNEALEVRNQFIRDTFGRYLTDEVVENILESPEGLSVGGDTRKVTILLSDIRGFSTLSEGLPPQQVVTLINTHLSVMTDIIQKYGGTIDEFLGDGILVIFGAPIFKADDAQRAVACAVEMQLAMETVNAQNHRNGLPSIAMGIGINTGEVVVGNIGSVKRAKYGVVGSHVNLTARIESYTKGGQILVSEATLLDTNSIVKVHQSMEIEPKGFTEKMTIYSVSGIGGQYNLSL